MIIEKSFQFDVRNGPSESGLLKSFSTAYAKKPNMPFKVLFELRPSQKAPHEVAPTTGGDYPAVITSIAHEDGSGESFNIGGVLYDDRNGTLKMPLTHNFTGYFNTHTRTGYLKVTYRFADDKN